MNHIHAVLLDIDGTLVASNDAHARAWVKALAETGREVPFAAVRPLIGMGGDKLLPRVSDLEADRGEGKRVSDRRAQIFLTEFVPHLRPTPGVERLLRELTERDVRLVVATSATKGELEPLLRVCGADRWIESATSSDDAEESKPDPDILHAAIEKLGLPREQIAMLGDTPYDVEAARRAGVRVIALRCGGWGDADLAADEVYADPADLADHLDDSLLGRGVRNEK
ncbi:hydrolase : Uncharacterized protein OS=Sorangium cellulosum So0157-2 GN=SCE1572_50600 PE=4 SV=1: HAD_2 [Gemmataceae bacterium]|nr:hydrolase : Uncharacterized protein OS=Sorangium cellulosum So0157-2 GN=SCE1572_50600 PE=4 SV=1: HAD_2 [Gemmataceae bacterium]VTU00448.1 hydrolase : Uncharacterized protein OS=Sorangium cellulosum So0157-2 GN=SCE1572_50600 PE=4 SV=1: HAD_2 [Gemmataceae bacterium]